MVKKGRMGVRLVGCWLIGVCLLGMAGGVRAAVEKLAPLSVGISFDQGAYLLGEEIPVRVLVRNNTTEEITLGRGNTPAGLMTVTRVNDSTRKPLPTNKNGCLPRPFKLKPNEERVFDLDLSKEVDFVSEGSYFVTFGAILYGMRYETKVKSIDIVPGSVVAEGVQLFAKAPGRQRHFTLVRWPRQHIDRLFLRVQDLPERRTFKTVMLGAYLPIVKPRLNIAPNGEVIVLHRATPDYYVRNVFWSLPDEFIQRSTTSLLDPATADTARLKGMQGDLDEVVKKNERVREALRLR